MPEKNNPDRSGRALPGLDEVICKELLDSMPDAILFVNSNGNIVRANKQMEKMFGYRQAELIGKPV